jgi:hypothetical protein
VAVTGGVRQLPTLGWRKVTALVGQVSRFCSVGPNGHWTYIAANREMGKEFGPEKKEIGPKASLVQERRKNAFPINFAEFGLIQMNLNDFKAKF